MKSLRLLSFFALLFFAGSDALLAQNGHVRIFQLNKLSASDTLLNGWRFKQGDDPRYALSGYDDNKWPAFDPDSGVDTFKYAGRICWLRLHLDIDSSLQTSDFGLMVFQNAASQIYLDGKLFKSFGILSPDPAAYNPLYFPEHMALAAGAHVIAVRLLVPKQFAGIQISGYGSNIFVSYINRYSAAVNNYLESMNTQHRQDAENLVLMGMFIILTITHASFYLYLRRQKAHLYYAIITALLAIDSWLNLGLQTDHSLLTAFWYDYTGNLTFVGFVFLPLTIYAIFGYTKRWAVKIILVISVVCMIFQYFDGQYDEILFFYVVPICNAIECVRVAIIARRHRQRGAIFIITGSLVFLALLGLQNSISGVPGEVLFVLMMVSLPIGMTVFLATQTALTYRALESKLVEVEELSGKNLQYQQEKQQILAGQNEMLERQVGERTAELSSALDNLKSTQNQLIQSEKMASLGELTAGIAHEIQNPLNFVNNFSEVSAELVDEMDDELDKGDLEEAKAIGADLKQNLEKIRHHGKRADAIVKGMLQHSRTGSGAKEPTDINALVEECMRLAYHNLSAKDKLFSAEMVTHFDEKLPLANVIPQDITRVMLNLFNNAFYAVNQKAKTAGGYFRPEVSVSTFNENGQVVVTVKDNGPGIPENIKDKIMQPFFTTKPTGEGTGLGLSLSYDIVVKGHGGSIRVNSIEGEGSEFIVILPI